MDLPRTIGRYEVLRLLGQGGMGRVLLATDTVLGRRVAIKILRDDLGLPPEAKEALFSRMRQEARAAASINHPHLVTLHDMGEEPPVGLYLVFEFVEGPTLREQISTGPLAPSDVADMARALGNALTVAHDAGVIHRDVKPENVLLSDAGAKLTDFGVARVPDSTLTVSGMVLGTPAYSAPEALISGRFGALSDQFSFAATMYEALTGRRAFEGDDGAEVAAKVAHSIPRPIASLLGAPAALGRADAVLERAMSKAPERRFGSCAEFGEALAEAIDVPLPPMHLTPTPLQSIVPRELRRKHNVAAGAGVLVIVGLLVWGRTTRPPAEHGAFRPASSAFATTIAPAHSGPGPRHPRPGAPSPSGAPAAPLSSALSNALPSAPSTAQADVEANARREEDRRAAETHPPPGALDAAPGSSATPPAGRTVAP